MTCFQEHVTDVLTGCPTLDDLGITPAIVEDRAIWELCKYVDYSNFEEGYGLYHKPAPPKSVEDLRLA